MKKILLVIAVLFSVNSFSQEIKLKEYSHTDFFKMIASEKDSIFELKDAFITFTKKDSAFAYEFVNGQIEFTTNDTIVINKKIDLYNVHFEHQKEEGGQGLPFLIFNKEVRIYNTTSLFFYNCIFRDNLEMDTSVLGNDQIIQFNKKYPKYGSDIGFYNCTFYKDVKLDIGSIENRSSINFYIFYSKFISKTKRKKVEFNTNSIQETSIDENIFKGNGYLNISVDNSIFTSIYSNDFGDYRMDLSKESFNDSQVYLVEKNIFNDSFLLHINHFSISNVYRWKQWKGKVLSSAGYDLYLKYLLEQNNELDYEELYKIDTVFDNYKNKYKFELDDSYKFEMQQLGQFYDFYKLQHDSDYANQVYIEFKDLETKRLAYLYNQNPSFKSFFTVKINQFLKVFSAYGTEPQRAVVFSMYVILLFALIYLFFPNSWDTNGKKRIMNRYAFFFTYMNKKAGIHEVYLEQQKNELLEFHEFKNLVAQQGKTVPKFFTATALPLYKWAISGSKLTEAFLSKIDIMKGTWNELPTKKRWWKSFLLIGAFSITICYDVLIKILNALMLSINTFTTLGFGEIPIKGLPRYLAIIQGFIGWFMLTLFSVSLISQLLN
ncbi:MAG: potassium channel family protein [Flavobacteriaceae bacterium]